MNLNNQLIVNMKNLKKIWKNYKKKQKNVQKEKSLLYKELKMIVWEMILKFLKKDLIYLLIKLKMFMKI